MKNKCYAYYGKKMEEKDYLDKIATQDDILQILTMVGEIGKEIKSGLDGSQGFRKNEYETVSKFLSLPHDENDGGNLTVRQLTYFVIGYRSGWFDCAKYFHDELSSQNKNT